MLKNISRIKIITVVIIFLLLIFTVISLCSFRKEIHITGNTMGTMYDIRVITKIFHSKRILQNRIACRLAEIDDRFSTYNNKSEISKFNSITNLEKKFYPSYDFLSLLLISKKLHKLTGTLWDPTVGPLVDIWGFGCAGIKKHIPEEDEINHLLGNVGFEKAVIFHEDGSIKKGFLGASIDLASIAKGFGVDQVASLLLKNDFENFLIEIGGEVYAKGLRKDNKCWRVGITCPNKKAQTTEIHRVLSLSDKAIATSGDYRNFFKIKDRYYSHIINPRTGYPVSNCITSVSVIAENCTIADGLATALMVFDPNEAITFINTLPFVECIITVTKDDNFKDYTSSGIKIFQ